MRRNYGKRAISLRVYGLDGVIKNLRWGLRKVISKRELKSLLGTVPGVLQLRLIDALNAR